MDGIFSREITREQDVFSNNEFINTIKYYPHFDRRHNINFVSSYKFGKIIAGN